MVGCFVGVGGKWRGRGREGVRLAGLGGDLMGKEGGEIRSGGLDG